MKVDKFWINAWIFTAILVFLLSLFSFLLWAGNSSLQSEEYKDYSYQDKKIINDITTSLLEESKACIILGILLLTITYLIYKLCGREYDSNIR